MIKPFEISLRVRYAETDAMGVVHHSRYFVWLESARVEWLRSLELDYKKMEKEGFFLPVVQVDLSYKMPAFFDDDLKVIVIPSEDFQHVRFTIVYEIMRENQCIAKGFTVHAFINQQRKLIKPPNFFVQKMQAIYG